MCFGEGVRLGVCFFVALCLGEKKRSLESRLQAVLDCFPLKADLRTRTKRLPRAGIRRMVRV